jgi:hypothetical protein
MQLSRATRLLDMVGDASAMHAQVQILLQVLNDAA